jgi:2-polyprenyl-6-methoxyphenol hydroxylase-like FAD-dependent oxidoreductase
MKLMWNGLKRDGERVAVVGAGPIGLCLSIMLSKLGMPVDLYDKRTLAQFDQPPDETKVLGTTFTIRG